LAQGLKSFFLIPLAMLTLGALLLGLARADAQNRLFVPLPGARAASFRSGQRVPVGQAVYMHHGVDHDHDWGFVTPEGAAFAPARAGSAGAEVMPFAWRVVSAALMMGIGVYAARCALLGVGGRHGNPREHYEAGMEEGDTRDRVMLGIGGHHGSPREHYEAGVEEGETRDRVMLGIGGHHGFPAEHFEAGTETNDAAALGVSGTVMEPPALSGLLARRPVVKDDGPKAVPQDVVERALAAALTAQNHFLSEPWRFYFAGPETKAKLCGLNEEKRKAAETVPEWLFVTVASEEEETSKRFYENNSPVACATRNFRLSLANDGVGSSWIGVESPWMRGALGAAPEAVLAAVGAGNGERLVGAVWFGYRAKELTEDAKTPLRFDEEKITTAIFLQQLTMLP